MLRARPTVDRHRYRAFFCQYASITAPNGKPIEIFGGGDLSSLQIYRAKSILAFYLEDVAGSLYGSDKGAVAERGTHAELARRRGSRYASFMRHQLKS